MKTLQEQLLFGENGFRMEYDLNKNMLIKKLFLHVKVDDEQYVSELVQE